MQYINLLGLLFMKLVFVIKLYHVYFLEFVFVSYQLNAETIPIMQITYHAYILDELDMLITHHAK